MLRQKSKIIQGIDREISQKINKIIKNSKFKVQFSIRGEELRITGAKETSSRSNSNYKKLRN